MFGEQFRTMAGVHIHFEAQGVQPEEARCEGCRERKPVYPWPLAGFGTRCAMCIVMESQNDAA